MLLPLMMSHRPILVLGFRLSLVFPPGDRAEVGVLSWDPGISFYYCLCPLGRISYAWAQGPAFVGRCLGTLLWEVPWFVSSRRISSFRNIVHLMFAKTVRSGAVLLFRMDG